VRAPADLLELYNTRLARCIDIADELSATMHEWRATMPPATHTTDYLADIRARLNDVYEQIQFLKGEHER
jgi:hypothetical protein